MGQVIDEKIIKISKNIDPISIVEWVKALPNDQELGKYIRSYVAYSESVVDKQSK